MKRFLVFAGGTYYPRGGWEDFIGAHDTYEQAFAAATRHNDDWWQIVDLEEMLIVDDSSVTDDATGELHKRRMGEQP